MWEWLRNLAVILAVNGGLCALYDRFIKPHTCKAKLLKIKAMINDWFDYIDRNLEKGVDFAELNNRENKICEFIKSNLNEYWIRPSSKIIKKWNRKMGLKKEFWNSHEMFKLYARIPANGIPLDVFFDLLVGTFLRFNNNYHKDPPGEYNYADLEMPVKFFRFYMREKGYGE